MSDNRREIDLLVNELLEDLLKTPDEKIIAEAIDDGIDVAQAASTVRSLIEKNRFKIAQKKIQSRMTHGFGISPEKRKIVDIGEARKRILEAFDKNPSYKDNFTMAARSGENLPDEDILGCYEDMIELGLIKEDQDLDEK